jgi:hypothetical protein
MTRFYEVGDIRAALSKHHPFVFKWGVTKTPAHPLYERDRVYGNWKHAEDSHELQQQEDSMTMPKDLKFEHSRPLAEVEQPLDLPLAQPAEAQLPVPVSPKPEQKLDPRRGLPIEVIKDGPIMYRLKILGVLWSTVEWSISKAVWCLEDACDRCLHHVEGIHGDPHSTAEDAIRQAKQMIRDSTMPTPEDARAHRDEIERRRRALRA